MKEETFEMLTLEFHKPLIEKWKFSRKIIRKYFSENYI